jgi:hypothetical protein
VTEDALPAFEAEAFHEKKAIVQPKPHRNALNRPSKQYRSDGISNLSNKTKSQGLSIPSEFVAEEETPEETVYTGAEESAKDRWARKRFEDPTEGVETSEKPMADLPWYLQPQHQASITPIFDAGNPMAERQMLPDLPVHPPKHLKEIVEHLSVQIGLDYLTILDLRRLDPPPGLGNNLIMIVGTSRSEKHLTVAGSRFCAHLRREFKLTPYADGLLGPNELKIKQRRQAKKATALANAGSRDKLEELDDGIKTGWVCVHVGHLDPHPEAELKPERRADGVIGFGEENNKVTVVVQMFTEEKRLMVDIEGLWQGILEKNLRAQERRTDRTSAVPDVDGEIAKADEDDETSLTPKELNARKKFKMGDKTVLDGLDQWNASQGNARSAEHTI